MTAGSGEPREKPHEKTPLEQSKFDFKSPATLAAIFSGLTLFWTIIFGMYAYFSDKRLAVAQEFRVKRDEAYGELLTLSQLIPSKPSL